MAAAHTHTACEVKKVFLRKKPTWFSSGVKKFELAADVFRTFENEIACIEFRMVVGRRTTGFEIWITCLNAIQPWLR